MSEKPKEKPEEKKEEKKDEKKVDEKPEVPAEPQIDPNVLLPETKREMEILWRKQLKLTEGEGGYRNSVWMFPRLRARHRMAKVLGVANRRQYAPELPFVRNHTNSIEQVYDIVAETRTGMLPYIKQRNPGKATKLKIAFIDKNGKRTNRKLSELVIDSDSKEAQMLSWFVSNAQNGPQILGDFYGSYTDFEVAQKALKAKEAYDLILKDSEGFDLDGKIQKAESNRQDIEAKRSGAKTNEEIAAFTTQLKQATEEINKLNGKKGNNSKNLVAFNEKLNLLGISEIPDIDLLSGNLAQITSKIPNANIALDGKQYSLRDILFEDKIKGIAEKLTERKRMQEKKPSAAFVLDEVLKRQYDSDVKHLSDAQRKIFYNQMQSTLLSENKSTAYNDAPPVYRDLNRNWRSLKDMFKGDNKAVRTVTAPVWMPIRGALRTATGLYKGFRPSSWSNLRGVEKISSLPGRGITNAARWLWSDTGK